MYSFKGLERGRHIGDFLDWLFWNLAKVDASYLLGLLVICKGGLEMVGILSIRCWAS